MVAHCLEQVLAVEVTRKAQLRYNCLIILYKRRLGIGVNPKYGASGVVTSAVGIIEGDLGFSVIVSLVASDYERCDRTRPRLGPRARRCGSQAKEAVPQACSGCRCVRRAARWDGMGSSGRQGAATLHWISFDPIISIAQGTTFGFIEIDVCNPA